MGFKSNLFSVTMTISVALKMKMEYIVSRGFTLFTAVSKEKKILFNV